MPRLAILVGTEGSAMVDPKPTPLVLYRRTSPEPAVSPQRQPNSVTATADKVPEVDTALIVVASGWVRMISPA